MSTYTGPESATTAEAGATYQAKPFAIGRAYKEAVGTAKSVFDKVTDEARASWPKSDAVAPGDRARSACEADCCQARLDADIAYLKAWSEAGAVRDAAEASAWAEYLEAARPAPGERLVPRPVRP
ncbi:MAG: hypothetical protein ACYCST_09950 [Acidimicrobiales bacterium]